MAYGRKRAVKKTAYRRKRTYRRKGFNWTGLAKKAFKTAKWVAGMVNAESKYYETSQAATPVDYNGTQSGLVAPGQGTGVSDREGDSIKVQNLEIKGSWKMNPGGVDEVCRLIIYNDKQNSIANVASFLDITGTSMAPYSHRNQDYKFDAKTLYDKSFSISTQKPVLQFKILLKIREHIHFVAGTTGITNNNLKILAITQSNANGSLLEYTSRATYLDN